MLADGLHPTSSLWSVENAGRHIVANNFKSIES
jgi:hypothetical protein